MSSSSISTFPPPELHDLAQQIATLLKARKQTISIAETAAGGLLSATLLSLPGASAYYAGGLTLYTLSSRLAYAGWSPSDISSYAGPSPAVVAGLAEHTRKTLGSTYTLSESGTAGPGGGKGKGRQVGYVAFAVAREGQETVTREVELAGVGGGRERGENMLGFAREGLGFLRDVLVGEGEGEEGV